MSTKLRVAMALSVAGMLLLPLFGLLLHFQPKFMHGLHVEAAVAERNCYIAAGCYSGLFILCGMAHCVWTRNERRREMERQALADEVIYGKKGTTRNDKSRSSSREDTTITLDSPFQDHQLHI